MKYKFLLVVSLIFVSACSASLNVEKVNLSKVSGSNGIVYALPFTQFEINVNQRITKCEASKKKNKGLNDGLIETDTNVDIKVLSKIDSKHVYAIDVTSLSTLMNHASTSVELYENTMMLKSINASVDDKASDIISSAVATGINLVTSSGLTSLFNAFAPLSIESSSNTGNAIDNITGCLVEKAFVDAKEQQKKVIALTEEIAFETLDMLRLKGKILKHKPGTNLDEEEKLARAIESLEVKALELALEEEKLAKLLKPITYSKKIIWPESSNIYQEEEIYKLPKSVARAWWQSFPEVSDESEEESKQNYSSKEAVSSLKKIQTIKQSKLNDKEKDSQYAHILEQIKSSNKRLSKYTLSNLIEDSVLSVSIDNQDKYGVQVSILIKLSEKEKENKSYRVNGIPYRSSANGVLLVCKGKKLVSCSNEKNTDVVYRVLTPIAQLGYVNKLPIEVKPFESSTFTGEWSKQGNIVKAGYTKTVSTVEGVVSLVKNTVDNYAKIKETKLQARKSKVQAELDILTNQIAIQEKQTGLSSGKEVATINAETTLLKAKQARLDAEQALAKLQE